MHEIEKELIKATNFKPLKKYDNRQEYLKSILNSVSKLPDEDFDTLSDEAATWANEAVAAHNTRSGLLPDFDEVEDVSDEEAEAEEVADEAETEAEAAEDELPHDQHEPDDEPAEEPEPVKAKKEKAPPKAAAKPIKPPLDPRDFRLEDQPEVIVDKFGCVVGSKNHRALAMFEKGATTTEVKNTIGGTYYNILKKMVQNGHRLEKEGAVITLTHSSDMKSGKAAVKPKKK